MLSVVSHDVIPILLLDILDTANLSPLTTDTVFSLQRLFQRQKYKN
jgi:hypothetical protein